MKKVIILLVIITFFADAYSGQRNNKRVINNTIEKAQEPDNAEYHATPVEGGIEYRRYNVIYLFRDGALITIEQLNWFRMDASSKYRLSQLIMYDNTPKEIIYTDKSGDKSQFETYCKITLEKTIFNYKGDSKDGHHVKEYEAPTNLYTWIKLSETFDWDKFSMLKSGASRKPYDGMDWTITVKTESGTYSVTNNDGYEKAKFFEIIDNYSQSVSKKTTEKVIKR